jgi:hypothetical protein
MSAIRVCRDGVWQWQRADDGAVGRVYGQDRGGMIAIGGSLVTAAPTPDYQAQYRARYPERVRESQRKSRAR